MTIYVHLVVGHDALERQRRVAELARASRRPVIVFSDTSEPPCTPMDWLMGPGCNCCLPAQHPRLRLIQAASASENSRMIIDAGTPLVADRIDSILSALPISLSLNLLSVPESQRSEGPLDSVQGSDRQVEIDVL